MNAERESNFADDEADRDGSIAMPPRIVSILAWDGLLPLAVAACIAGVQWIFPPGHLAEFVAAFIVPLVAAVIRAAVAHEQLTRRCQGTAPLNRQLALAAAIVLLWLFELFACVITFAKPPLTVWVWSAAFYLAYIAAICWALRPYVSAGVDN
jgi:hypothetical protein